MNKKAIFEIGDIIHVRRNLIKKLSAKEIIDTYEFQMFKKEYPELCKLAEGIKDD